MDARWIYVFMTSTDYNRFKVGLTKNDPMLRINQLKTGDPRIALKVAYLIPDALGKLKGIEDAIHDQLGNPIEFHNGEDSEWFVGDQQDAWLVVDTIFEILGYEVTDYFQPFETKVVRFWEENLISFYEPTPKTDQYGIPWGN
jgi:hypothetical protein